MGPLRMIGLDLSLTGTGIAHTHDHNGKPAIGCRTVHTGGRRGHDRIQDILVDVAAAARSCPHIAVVEGAFVGQNNNTVPLAELRGVVLHWLWTKGVPYVSIAPSTLKVWAAGNGAATKTAVREAVTADYGHLCHVGDDNQADALALLAMGMHVYGQPLAQVLNPRKLRAVDPAIWPTLEHPLSGSAAALTAAGRGAGR